MAKLKRTSDPRCTEPGCAKGLPHIAHQGPNGPVCSVEHLRAALNRERKSTRFAPLDPELLAEIPDIDEVDLLGDLEPTPCP